MDVLSQGSIKYNATGNEDFFDASGHTVAPVVHAVAPVKKPVKHKKSKMDGNDEDFFDASGHTMVANKSAAHSKSKKDSSKMDGDDEDFFNAAGVGTASTPPLGNQVGVNNTTTPAGSKFGNFINKIKNSGALNQALNSIQQNKTNGVQPTVVNLSNPNGYGQSGQNQGQNQGLSTMAWVGIGAGVIGLGTIIYFVTKKK